jgi:elongation factor Ts
MANYTAADVKKLRELTGAGMMDCKKALDEADGNVDKAVEALRIKGQKGVAKREGRSAENGAVVSIIADDNSSGVIVELKCETDFVAKGDKFQAAAKTIAEHVAKTAPADLEALLASEIEAGKTVQAFVDEANANLGEKIVLDRFAQFADGYVTAYMHRTMPDLPPQIGVLVELDKPNAEVAKGVAQHIAAFAPKYLAKEDVPAEVVESERRGSPQRLLQGRHAARPALRAGQQEVRPEGPGRGRCHPEALLAHQGRHLSPYRDRRPTPIRSAAVVRVRRHRGGGRQQI